MQTILGAGGAIGQTLAKALLTYTQKIRLVSRNPQKVNPSDELFKADLLDSDAVSTAVEGSDVVYLCAGIEYNHKNWQQKWPLIMRNTIAACKTHNAKLVFFDNIYMYDPNRLNGMTEETPLHPVSKKGKVRKQLVDMLSKEMERGDIKVLIARSADFYGPGVKTVSVLSQTIIENLAKGKRAQILGNPEKKHSYTYVPDAGKATALLGNTEDAYQQVWHLPTAGEPPTLAEWVELFAKELKVKAKYMSMGSGMLKFIGLFVPIMRELAEMNYQNENDYVFDSSKFEKRFNMTPTSYNEGIKAIVEADYST